MSRLDVQGVKKALTEAGVEIYRTQGSTLQIAERVRLHIMDSGIRVVVHPESEADPLEVRFTARAQRSDFGSLEPQLLFDRVRQAVGGLAAARGFVEDATRALDVTDPVERSRVLDVWYEVSYAKRLATAADAAAEIQWALGIEKYVQ